MRISAILLVALAVGCADNTSPPIDPGSTWVLESVGGDPLPARIADTGTDLLIVRETLSFGVDSPQYAVRPLARGDRIVRHSDGTEAAEQWFFTYRESGRLTYTIEPLCSDGFSLASCIDLSGVATLERSDLRIRFNEASRHRELRYRQSQ